MQFASRNQVFTQAVVNPFLSLPGPRVAAMRFASRNKVFTQIAIDTFLSVLKIIFTDCVVVAVPVKFKLWPLSPILLGMVVLF